MKSSVTVGMISALLSLGLRLALGRVLWEKNGKLSPQAYFFRTSSAAIGNGRVMMCCSGCDAVALSNRFKMRREGMSRAMNEEQ